MNEVWIQQQSYSTKRQTTAKNEIVLKEQMLARWLETFKYTGSVVTYRHTFMKHEAGLGSTFRQIHIQVFLFFEKNKYIHT